MKKIILVILVSCSVNGYSQNLIDSYLSGSVTNTVIGTSSDGVNSPRDLDFKPNSNELWVANKGGTSGGSMVIFYSAGRTGQTSELRKDSHSSHFMIYPSAIAFGDDGRWACVSEIKSTASATSTFMGPALWSSDTSIFAHVFQNNWVNGYPLGSHLDMLHQSPFGMGIAHDSAGAYWVFDGYNNDICKYNFVADHGPGYENHSQGTISRYTDVVVSRQPNVPSHMVKDKATGWLYFVDAGNKKLKRLNTNTGSVAGTLTVPTTASEPLLSYWNMTGATVEVLDSFTSTQPCGIDLFNGRLIVSDYATGDIYVYNITSATPTRTGIISTGLTGIMGVKIGADGKIWCVNYTSSKVYRLDPSAAVNDDASILAITAPVLDNYEPRFFNIKFNDCANSIVPVVLLENSGANTLTSATINYVIDNGTLSTYSWTGSLATNANVSVTLPSITVTSGTHKLTAYSSNPNGTADKNPANDRKQGSFRMLNPITSYPFNETFSSAVFPPTGWSYINFNPNNKMSQIASVGGFGVNTGSVKMDNFSGAENITGQVDYLMTPRIDMSSAPSGTVLDFSVAYAQYDASSNDELTVKVSIDCGDNWTTIYDKAGTALSTTAVATSAFIPTATDWRKERISLSAYAGKPNVLIMFSSISNYGNNIYIDDVNMKNATGVDELLLEKSVAVYPNPGNGIFNIEVATGNNFEITVYDLLGKIVKTRSANSKLELDLSEQSSGCYFIHLTSNGKNFYQKIALIK